MCIRDRNTFPHHIIKQIQVAFIAGTMNHAGTQDIDCLLYTSAAGVMHFSHISLLVIDIVGNVGHGGDNVHVKFTVKAFLHLSLIHISWTHRNVLPGPRR